VRSRRHAPDGVNHDDGDSYYVSMTDMMIGIVFIFIIMLAYFAMQFRSTTAALTSAKDAQTTALLQVATSLQPKTINAEIDEKAHVLCVPGTALGAEDGGRHCFAYSGNAPRTAATPQDKANAERASLVGQMESDLDSAQLPVTGDSNNGNLTFPADQIFVPNTANLSPGGEAIAQKVAAMLVQRLPCYAYGAPANGCDTQGMKLAQADIVTSASFDAFTDQGRAQAALALQRSVAFHDALVKLQPVLGQLRTASPEQGGGQPLLQVASWGQSQAALPQGGSQSLTIDFNMAPPAR
jgi:Tfp pilus assembly protein PilV